MTLADYAAQFETEAAPKRAAFIDAVRKPMAESGLSKHEQSGVLQGLAYEAARAFVDDPSKGVVVGEQSRGAVE